MEFGWISLFGAAIVAIMLIPNILYAVKHRGSANKCKNVLMNCIEQAGRYSCLVLMWLPLLVWKFSFSSVAELLLYLFCNGILLLAYLVVWVFHFRKPTAGTAMALAVIPTLIFALSGALLRHRLLVAAAVLFGVGHIYVTKQNEEHSE